MGAEQSKQYATLDQRKKQYQKRETLGNVSVTSISGLDRVSAAALQAQDSSLSLRSDRESTTSYPGDLSQRNCRQERVSAFTQATAKVPSTQQTAHQNNIPSKDLLVFQ